MIHQLKLALAFFVLGVSTFAIPIAMPLSLPLGIFFTFIYIVAAVVLDRDIARKRAQKERDASRANNGELLRILDGAHILARKALSIPGTKR
jgi:membrane protein implicated in regulation of membrane protease activity